MGPIPSSRSCVRSRRAGGRPTTPRTRRPSRPCTLRMPTAACTKGPAWTEVPPHASASQLIAGVMRTLEVPVPSHPASPCGREADQA